MKKQSCKKSRNAMSLANLFLGTLVILMSCSSDTNPSGTHVPSLSPEVSDMRQESSQSPSQSPSKADNTDELDFYFDGNNYRFAVTTGGKEIIAYREDDVFTDLFGGVGTYEINSQSGIPLMYATGIDRLESYEENGVTGIIVWYRLEGSAKDTSTGYTKYLFHPDYIESVAGFECRSDKYSAYPYASKFKRGIQVKYGMGFSTTPVGKWVFPEDGDYPYRDFESIMTKHEIYGYNVYTFIGETGLQGQLRLDAFPSESIPIDFPEADSVSFTLRMSIRLDRSDSETDNNADARAYCLGNDFSTSVTIDGQPDKTAVVKGDGATLNIRVKNISDSVKTVNLDYSLYDYYGNGKTASNAYALEPLEENVCKITLDGSVLGSYWLDYSTSAEQRELRELFAFALLPEFTPKHRDTNPFGISGVVATIPDIETTAIMLDKINASVARLSIPATQEIVNHAKIASGFGIRLFAQHGYWGVPTDPEANEAEIRANYELVKDYVVAYQVGNELNGLVGVMSGGDFDVFLSKYFLPGYKAIKESTDMPFMLHAIAGPDTVWWDKVAKEIEMDKFDIISYHPYGIPTSPDNKENTGYWSVEHAIRIFMEAVREVTDKPVWITETGYCDVPGVSHYMDQRTVADYMPRTYAIAMSEGIEAVCWYCLIDVGFGQAFDPVDGQYHFGVYYTPDINGIVMPKVSAVSFATMSRVLDGADKTVRVETSDENDRFYDVALLDGRHIAMLWTAEFPMETDDVRNIGSPASPRIPRLPWEEHWADTVSRTFRSEQPEVWVTDIMGNKTAYTVIDGEVTLKLSGSPVYVEGLSFSELASLGDSVGVSALPH